jgi:hypothetical protein
LLEELAAPGTEAGKNDPIAAFDRMRMLNRLDDERAARSIANSGFGRCKLS